MIALPDDTVLLTDSRKAQKPGPHKSDSRPFGSHAYECKCKIQRLLLFLTTILKNVSQEGAAWLPAQTLEASPSWLTVCIDEFQTDTRKIGSLQTGEEIVVCNL